MSAGRPTHPGYYVSGIGNSGQTACAVGKYSASGAAVCTPCDDPNGNTGAAYHWLGEGLSFLIVWCVKRDTLAPTAISKAVM